MLKNTKYAFNCRRLRRNFVLQFSWVYKIPEYTGKDLVTGCGAQVRNFMSGLNEAFIRSILHKFKIGI